MTSQNEERQVAFEVLKKYGMKWAVLTAMRVDMVKKGLLIPEEVVRDLLMAVVKIRSGCFSTCDVGCSLSRVEGQLISRGFALGEDYLREWSTLLARAFQGDLNPDQTAQIPALQPVQTDCEWLACRCSEVHSSLN